MTATTFSEQHRIVYYECDRTGRATLATLINIVILASQDQSDQLGLTTDFVQSHGVGWVVTQYAMEINRMPKLDEVVTLKARGTSYNEYFAFREFWVEAADGTQLAYITSIWVTMDQQARRIVKIPADVVAPYHSEKVKRIPRLPRPANFEPGDVTDQKDYQVRFFDIDPNRHVNNAHYFAWLLDTLPAEFLLQHDLKHVTVRYENEVRYGQLVHSLAKQTLTDDQLTTRHQILVDQEKCCDVTIEWQPKVD